MLDADKDRLLDEIVAQIREQDVPEFPRESVSSRLDTLLKRRADAEAVPKSFRMRSWQLVAAGALAIGVACCALWLGSVIDDRKALAFADVKQAVAAAQTMRYRILHFSNDRSYLLTYNLKPGEPAVSRVMCSGNRVRNEQPLGVTSIVDWDKKVSMAIWQSRVLAIIEPIYETESAKRASEFHVMLRNIPASAAKRLPDRELDGRRVSEYLVQRDNRTLTVTVDPKTKLPVRMEVVYRKNPENGQVEVGEVYTDFEFDIPLDEALFRMEAPEGYTLKNRLPKNDRPQPPETMELVVSPEDGIGPVKFGTKVADIVRLLGEPDWLEEEDNFGHVRTELGYDRRGFRLSALQNELYGILCLDERRGVISFPGRTKEGIALGAPLDDVLKTYGKPDAQIDSTVFYAKRGYRFWFVDKKLMEIEVKRPNPNVEIEVRGRGWTERIRP